MMPLVWKIKNNGRKIPENQIKGLIALCLLMAVIPFFYFLYAYHSSHRPPAYSDQRQGMQPVEIIGSDGRGEIYFFAPGTSAHELFAQAGYPQRSAPDYTLRGGIKIFVATAYSDKKATLAEMDAAKKLALGMPLDINRATKEELVLISGIGEHTAEKIIRLRAQLGGFAELEQLMKIKGIKEKKLAKFRNYLFVEKNRQ